MLLNLLALDFAKTRAVEANKGLQHVESGNVIFVVDITSMGVDA